MKPILARLGEVGLLVSLVVGGSACGGHGGQATDSTTTQAMGSRYTDPWLEHECRATDLFVLVDVDAIRSVGQHTAEFDVVQQEYEVDLTGAEVSSGNAGLEATGLGKIRFIREPDVLRDLHGALQGSRRALLLIQHVENPQTGAFILLRENLDGALDSVDWDDGDGELAAFLAELAKSDLTITEGLAALGRASIGLDQSPAALALLEAVRRAHPDNPDGSD